jgi:hypothetical protein
MQSRAIAKGTDTIQTLARRLPQLYVAPADGAQELHRAAAGRGVVPPDADLSHFADSEEDELREVDTPAGPVEVLFLARRADFETFLRVVGHRSEPVPIARTIGAITYRGLADWGKVAVAREGYLSSGGADWPAEFARLARMPGAFRTELVVISQGPYSGVPAAETPFGEDEWLRVSREVRLHHECAHVVCRRIMPDDILPVWDEVTADVCGLLCACGSYDVGLACRFLGVCETGYVGGRLAEYLDEGQLATIDKVAVEVHAAALSVEEMARACDVRSDPFGFLLDLKREPLLAY